MVTLRQQNQNTPITGFQSRFVDVWWRLLLVTLVCICISCTSIQPACNTKPCRVKTVDSSQINQRLILIGDAGKLTKKAGKGIKRKALLRALRNYLTVVSEATTIVFLGDNIYPHGLPDQDDFPIGQDTHCSKRACAEKRLNVQLDLLEQSGARGIFVPGNHDWDKAGKSGWRFIDNLQTYILTQQQQRNINVSLMPEHGCPGPSQVILPGLSSAKGVMLLLVDTQWWLHQYDKPSQQNPASCPAVTKQAVIQLLAQHIESARRDHLHVIIAGHHAFESNGKHAGYITMKGLSNPLQLLSGLRNRTPWASPQSLENPTYKAMRQQFETVFQSAAERGLKSLIYAAGHDHSLQVLKSQQPGSSIYYLVSGLGSGTEYPVGSDSRTLFSRVSKQGGFMVVDYLKTGQIRLAVIVPTEKRAVCQSTKANCEVFSTWLPAGEV